MNLTTILIVLLIVALCGGYAGRGSFWSWSPAGLLILILLVLWLAGYFR